MRTLQFQRSGGCAPTKLTVSPRQVGGETNLNLTKYPLPFRMSKIITEAQEQCHENTTMTPHVSLNRTFIFLQ